MDINVTHQLEGVTTNREDRDQRLRSVHATIERTKVFSKQGAGPGRDP